MLNEIHLCDALIVHATCCVCVCMGAHAFMCVCVRTGVNAIYATRQTMTAPKKGSKVSICSTAPHRTAQHGTAGQRASRRA